MALSNNISNLSTQVQNLTQEAFDTVKGILGYAGQGDFSPEEVRINTKNIDPRFIAQAPMSNQSLDMHTLVQLGAMGLKRGKEITAKTHPELYQTWAEMSMRAGFKHPPQLILCESKTVNALTISKDEVAMTTSLLKLLNFREVRAVLGHELGHGISDHTTPRFLATLALSIPGGIVGEVATRRLFTPAAHASSSGLWPRIQRAVTNGQSSLANFMVMIVGIYAGATVGSTVANQLSVRPTELDADYKGAKISNDPEGLISALDKLEKSRKHAPVLNFLAHLNSGYPSTETRIRHLRELPQTLPPAAAAVAFTETPQVDVSMLGTSPTALITGAALAERVGTPVAPSLANG